MDWSKAFEEVAAENLKVSIAAEARIASRPAAKRPVELINFDHGEYGWLGNPVTGAVDWDGMSDEEPTDEDSEVAYDYWDNKK